MMESSWRVNTAPIEMCELLFFKQIPCLNEIERFIIFVTFGTLFLCPLFCYRPGMGLVALYTVSSHKFQMQGMLSDILDAGVTIGTDVN